MKVLDSRSYLLVLLVALPGCLGGGLATMGGYTLVGPAEMSKVQEIGDPGLTADAKRLEGKNIAAGTAEYYAAMCFQSYVNARHAEHLLAQSGGAENPAVQGDMSQYGHCASTCQSAYTQLQSEYSDLAAKYHPLCEQGFAGLKSKFTMDALANAVESFRNGKAPLEFFYADRDCKQLLEQARNENPSAAGLAEHEAEVARLSKHHAAAILEAKAFLDSPKVQDNIAQREAVEAERRAIQADIDAIRAQQDELNRNGSLDAYMAKRNLDDQIRAKERLLETKNRELERLQEQYETMANKSGMVYEAR